MNTYNGEGNGKQDGNGFADMAWILPFMMLGAMFGSLIAARISLRVMDQAPFGLAVIGAVGGMIIVGLLGWLLMNWYQSQI